MSRWYQVVSPEFSYVEVVIPETGQGPTMDTCDVAAVKAPNANAAKWMATHLWEIYGGVDCWPKIARRDGRHPLSGVKATRWEDLPENAREASTPQRSVWEPFYAEGPHWEWTP